jgi:hypothetical protein
VVAADILGNGAAGILIARGTQRWRLIALASIVMGLCGIAIFLAPLPAHSILLLCLIFSAVGGFLPATALTSVPFLAPTPHLAPMGLGLVMQGSNLGQSWHPLCGRRCRQSGMERCRCMARRHLLPPSLFRLLSFYVAFPA